VKLTRSLNLRGSQVAEEKLYPTGQTAPVRPSRYLAVSLLGATLLLSGCSSTHQWWKNGFKVGPNHCTPAAPIADDWLDSQDPNVVSAPMDYSYWWSVFQDPVLDELVDTAYHENLTLKIASQRIMEARAQRGIAMGNLFPQQQQLFGGYTRQELSDKAYPFGEFPIRKHYDDWITGFDATWELDIWGRIHRGIESADANLDAQVANYDDILVMIQAEVASAYLQLRTTEERLALAHENVELQEHTLKIIQHRFDQGVVSELDLRQAKSALAATRSLIPALEEGHRKAETGLCILLGLPPQQLPALERGPQAIPQVPPEVIVGIPAELLMRRPDIRKAERQAAAQCAQIGIATAELYPHIAISGNIAFNAEHFQELFTSEAITGSIGPGFQWNILNYGRIKNNILVQDARFHQLVYMYQNTVLQANKEAEDGIVSFLKEKVRAQLLEEGVQETEKATELAMLQYEQGFADYQRVLDTQRSLVLQQDGLAESRGKVALNLVAVYKALGGGWQMRCAMNETPAVVSATAPLENEAPMPSQSSTTPVPLPAVVQSLPQVAKSAR
jgi:NodT family efflux transporter outer membrane factor (OMF) lipoprotein